ncbi:MAG: Bro-N domain-containing protein [Burkholderiales bacterium]|nr:Bro-N domain-containing protein [Burkholderiales bacterium]
MTDVRNNGGTPCATAIYSFRKHTVRIVIRDGEPWFIAADVCAALGYDRVPHAMRMLDADEKGVQIADTVGGPQSVSVISESGLYSLILRSRRRESRAFQKWVTGEVLPSIRKTGAYGKQTAADRRFLLTLRDGKVTTQEVPNDSFFISHAEILDLIRQSCNPVFSSNYIGEIMHACADRVTEDNAKWREHAAWLRKALGAAQLQRQQ